MLLAILMTSAALAQTTAANLEEPSVGDDMEAYVSRRFNEKGPLYARWFAEELRGLGLDVRTDTTGGIQVLPRIEALSCVSGVGAEVCRANVIWTVSAADGAELWSAGTVGEYQRRRKEGTGGLIGAATGGYGANDRIQAREGALFVATQSVSSQRGFVLALNGQSSTDAISQTYLPVTEVPVGHLRPAKNRVVGSVLVLAATPVFYTGILALAAEIATDRPLIVGPSILGGGAGLLIGGTALVISGQIGVGRYWRQYESERPKFHVKL